MREQQKVEIAEFVACTVEVRRRVNNRSKAQRSIGERWRDRIQRIREQGIIPCVFVPTEQHAEVVPFVLADVQPGYILGVSAVTEIAEEQSIEERTFMVQGSHLGCEVEQSRTLLQIHERVISCLATGNVCEAVAEFHGLFDVVISLLNAFQIWLLRGATFCSKQEECCAEKKDRGFRERTKEVFEADSDSTHRPPPHGLKNTLLELERGKACTPDTSGLAYET